MPLLKFVFSFKYPVFIIMDITDLVNSKPEINGFNKHLFFGIFVESLRSFNQIQAFGIWR